MKKSFSFSYELFLSEKEYVAIWHAAKSPKRWRMLISQGIIAIVIVALSFLSIYTIVFGIAVACFFLFLGLIGFFPQLVYRNTYRKLRYLHQPFIYSIDNKGISIKGKYLETWATWDLFVTWHIVNNWLIITYESIPKAYFKIDQLKQAGIYEQVMFTVRKYGKEFE